jgi:hypothetical protein
MFKIHFAVFPPCSNVHFTNLDRPDQPKGRRVERSGELFNALAKRLGHIKFSV